MKVTFLLVCFLTSSSYVVSSNEKWKESTHYKRSLISEFVDKIIRKLKGEGKDVGKKCFEKISKGEIPSAEHEDSPLKTFGYPFFDIHSKSVTVKPGATLSYMFGHRQPVKIGSRDYVIAGYENELLAFFACFESYKVIGSSLNGNGHWVSDTGSIKIQVQNLNTKYPTLSSSIFDILFKYSLDRIIKYLKPVQIIKGIEAQIMGDTGAAKDLDSMTKMMGYIEKWLPGSDKMANKILEIYQKPTSLKDKVSEFIKFIEDEEIGKSALRKQWIGWDNVFKNKKILVTLTMYSKPEHGVRSTFYTGNSTITMGDVGNAIKVFLEKEEPAFKSE